VTDLLDPQDARWDERLQDVPHDVYHGAGYHRYSAFSDGVTAFLAIVGDRDRGIAWPYLLRPVSAVAGLDGTGAKDVDSVYGYPGPLAWGCQPGDPFLARAWNDICDIWRSQGAVSVFTRFHPLLENVEFARSFVAVGLPRSRRSPVYAAVPSQSPIVAGGMTVSMDASIDDEEAVRQYSRVLRQEIARSRRAGLRSDEDHDWRELDAFTALYADTMARNHAGAAYGLTRNDAVRLREALGPHIHLLVTRLEGVVVAAGLFTDFQGIVQAFLVGTDDTYRTLSPLKVLLDDARRWAHRRGDDVLHLGGGRGAEGDSLFAFKSRFSSRRHTFHTGRWILDPEAYEELVAVRRTFTADRGEAIADPTWFPAYRSPLADAEPAERGEVRPEHNGDSVVARRPRDPAPP
jgi:hypothetical protein